MKIAFRRSLWQTSSRPGFRPIYDGKLIDLDQESGVAEQISASCRFESEADHPLPARSRHGRSAGFALHVGCPAAVARDSKADMHAPYSRLPLFWMRRLVRFDGVHIAAQIGNINVPTLIMAGASDRLDPPIRLEAELLPRITQSVMHKLPGIGHLSMLEPPDAVSALITELCDGLKHSVAGSMWSWQKPWVAFRATRKTLPGFTSA